MKKFVLGLTGGIASGKSVAAELLRKKGAHIVDADLISREVVADACIIAKISEAFPESVENGAINRKKLRETVFSSPEKTKRLNSITHPEIIKRCLLRTAETDGVVVLVVPLMFETGLNAACDAVATVSCDTDTRIKRIVKRDNTDVDTAKNIIERQLSDDEREKLADYVVDNNGSVYELNQKIEQLVGKLGLFEQ